MPTPKGKRQGGDHWWINPSGMSKAERDKLRKATNPGNKRGTGRTTPPVVIPHQYIGKGKEAEKAARKIAKSLKGAEVYSAPYGTSAANQTLWTRLAHRLIDILFKGKK